MAAISSFLANDRGRVDVSTIGGVGYPFGGRYVATILPENDPGIVAMATITGTPGNDVLVGTNLQDDIDAGAGDDQVDGKEGYDLIHGGLGNDTLYGGSAFDPSRGSGGDDIVYGDEGDDFVAGGQGTDTLYGGDGNDRLFGDDEFVNLSGDDTLYGGAGDDLLNGGWGSNALYGGDGNDILYSWGYNYTGVYNNNSGTIRDTLYGGAGDDTYWIVGAQGNDDSVREEVGGGYDTVMLLDSESTGGVENVERIYLFVTDGFLARSNNRGASFVDNAESNLVYGTPYADSINMSRGGATETVFGYAGNDHIAGSSVGSGLGGGVADWFYGGDGKDTLEGYGNDDHLFGEAGNDSLEGGEGRDELAGGAGDDLIFDKAGGGDLLYGEDGNDLIQVSGTNTGAFIYGDAGDDQLWAGDGNDQVVGGTGNDILYGGAGNDGLMGGAGNDQMRGEAGEDHFYFGDRATGNDIIYDFSAEVGRGPAHDLLVFDPSVFTDYDTVMAASAQVGGDVVITISQGNTITLWGGILEALTPDDFYFG